MTPEEFRQASECLARNLSESIEAGLPRVAEMSDLAERVFRGEWIDWPLVDPELLDLMAKIAGCTVATAYNQRKLQRIARSN